MVITKAVGSYLGVTCRNKRNVVNYHNILSFSQNDHIGSVVV